MRLFKQYNHSMFILTDVVRRAYVVLNHNMCWHYKTTTITFYIC